MFEGCIELYKTQTTLALMKGKCANCGHTRSCRFIQLERKFYKFETYKSKVKFY